MNKAYVNEQKNFVIASVSDAIQSVTHRLWRTYNTGLLRFTRNDKREKPPTNHHQPTTSNKKIAQMGDVL